MPKTTRAPLEFSRFLLCVFLPVFAAVVCPIFAPAYHGEIIPRDGLLAVALAAILSERAAARSSGAEKLADVKPVDLAVVVMLGIASTFCAAYFGVWARAALARSGHE